jgi:hypothetical protein
VCVWEGGFGLAAAIRWPSVRTDVHTKACVHSKSTLPTRPHSTPSPPPQITKSTPPHPAHKAHTHTQIKYPPDQVLLLAAVGLHERRLLRAVQPLALEPLHLLAQRRDLLWLLLLSSLRLLLLLLVVVVSDSGGGCWLLLLLLLVVVVGD